LFGAAPPIDFAETDLGFVGCQNKMMLRIPQGQITIDAKRGQIFLIQGTQAMDISGFGSGMNRFFTDHLAFEILRYFPTVNTDNHFKNIGIHGVFDSKFERVIITKLDYIPQPNKDVFYDEEAKEFYVNQPIAGNLMVKKYVAMTDLEYFCNKSWTASFNLNTKSWVSFHTYLPNFYIGENNFFYSGLNESCDITAVAVTEIASPTTTTTTTTILYCNLSGTAVIAEYPCNFEGTAVVAGYPCALEGTSNCIDCTTTTTTSSSTSTTTTSTSSSTTTTSTSSTTTSTSSTTTTTSSTTTTTTTTVPETYVVSFTMEQKDDGFDNYWAEANIVLNQAVTVNTTFLIDFVFNGVTYNNTPIYFIVGQSDVIGQNVTGNQPGGGISGPCIASVTGEAVTYVGYGC
jgi:hypothetical protein